jgi:hypothetical protein
MSLDRIAAWGSSIVVLVAITAGLIVLGTPEQERARRFDDRRIADVQRLAFAVRTAYVREGELPGSLDELVDGLTLERLPRDPRLDEPYGYAVEGPERFTLCAIFDRASEEPDAGFWAHGTGRQCFSFDAEQGVPGLVGPRLPPPVPVAP